MSNFSLSDYFGNCKFEKTKKQKRTEEEAFNCARLKCLFCVFFIDNVSFNGAIELFSISRNEFADCKGITDNISD